MNGKKTARPSRHERRGRFQRRRLFAARAGLRRRRRDDESWPQDCLSRAEDKCCGPQAIADARGVAHAFGIPHYVVDEADQFERVVIDYFSSEYQAGRTPNPCVMCNEKLKFGSLWEKARALGCDYIATGIYAIIEHPDAIATAPSCARAPTREKISRIFSSACARRNCAARSPRSARCPSRKSARSRVR